MRASDCARPDAGDGPPLGHQLLRYVLPVGLCAEPEGDLFQAQATRRRNKAALKRWMPHYARLHGVLALLMLALCDSVSAAEPAQWLVALAAVPTAAEVVMAVTFACIACVAWAEVD